MAARQISDIAIDPRDEKTLLRKSEWLIDASTDTSDIPAVAPGSLAYTADLSYMAMYDGTQWHEIGG